VKVAGAKVLVTGANRGLGKALVQGLRDAGAAKIYAGARNAQTITPAAGDEPVALDVTKPEQVAAAAARCGDVDILINNAGVAVIIPMLAAPTMDEARLEMETNYFGTLSMCRAFAPILARNGGGALVNILSVVSWFSVPMQGAYCASKAAAWSLRKSWVRPSAADQRAPPAWTAELVDLRAARLERRGTEGVDCARERVEHADLQPLAPIGRQVLVPRAQAESRDALCLTGARDDRISVIHRFRLSSTDHRMGFSSNNRATRAESRYARTRTITASRKLTTQQ